MKMHIELVISACNRESKPTHCDSYLAMTMNLNGMNNELVQGLLITKCKFLNTVFLKRPSHHNLIILAILLTFKENLYRRRTLMCAKFGICNELFELRFHF